VQVGHEPLTRVVSLGTSNGTTSTIP
jgi:hypothetical protein